MLISCQTSIAKLDRGSGGGLPPSRSSRFIQSRVSIYRPPRRQMQVCHPSISIPIMIVTIYSLSHRRSVPTHSRRQSSCCTLQSNYRTNISHSSLCHNSTRICHDPNLHENEQAVLAETATPDVKEFLELCSCSSLPGDISNPKSSGAKTGPALVPWYNPQVPFMFSSYATQDIIGYRLNDSHSTISFADVDHDRQCAIWWFFVLVVRRRDSYPLYRIAVMALDQFFALPHQFVIVRALCLEYLHPGCHHRLRMFTAQ